MHKFDGKVVFITGASSGIGAALAREFARRGADVALTARRLDRMESLAKDIVAQGRRALPVVCDVTRDGDLERAVAETKRVLGRIDVVVANAGFGVVGRFEKLSLEDFRRQFETNVFGVLRTIYASLDELKATKGRLVLIGSVNGHLAPPSTSAYGMSKFALTGLAQALGHELRPTGVGVTLISPGLVQSEIHTVDNKGVHHAGAKDAFGRMRMPTDKAARQMVSAIARGKREQVITKLGKAAVFAQRHTPWLVSAVLQRGLKGRPEPRSRRDD